jgi:dephospho-CoA kinase
LQLQRACARDNSEPEQIQRIIDAQMSRQEKRDKADFVLDNSLDLATLPGRVLQLHQQFLALAEKKTKDKPL